MEIIRLPTELPDPIIPMTLQEMCTGLKTIDYEFDLISGKVNKVLYQDGKWDQFYHWYKYDAENRLTDVLTSRDNIDFTESQWNKEARYQYYLHGPLARTILGQQNVQV